MTKLIDYYDENVWGDIYKGRFLLQREKVCIDLIQEKKDEIKTVLDIGCGNGFFLSNLSSKLGDSTKYHGIDYSKYTVKEAKKLVPFGKFVQGNIEDGLPYMDGQFDLVYAAELVEHLQNPDYFFEEVYRVVKPGGYVVISTPNLCAWYNRLLVLLGIQPIFYETSTRSPQIGSGVLKKIKKGTVPVGHVRIFTQRALKDHLLTAGFRVGSSRGANFAALPKPMLMVDSAFSYYPRLSSNLIYIAKK